MRTVADARSWQTSYCRVMTKTFVAVGSLQNDADREPMRDKRHQHDIGDLDRIRFSGRKASVTPTANSAQDVTAAITHVPFGRGK